MRALFESPDLELVHLRISLTYEHLELKLACGWELHVVGGESQIGKHRAGRRHAIDL